MSLEAFEKAAKDADRGLPAAIGELQKLYDEGRLTNWLIVYDCVNPKGAPILGYERSDSLAAVGMTEYVKANILAMWNAGPLDNAEVDDLEPT